MVVWKIKVNWFLAGVTAGSLHRSRHCVQVESSCIENTKLERKEEKKPKERKLRRRRQNSHYASVS
jgi:hypothetical protein